MADATFIEIRQTPLTSTDARSLITALNDEMLQLYPEAGTEEHFRLDEHEVAVGRGIFLVAYSGPHAISRGAIRLLEPDTAELKRMYVTRAARGKGVGKGILRELEAVTQDLGAARIVLETGVRQQAAITLYTASGYTRRGPFGDLEDSPLSVFMQKNL